MSTYYKEQLSKLNPNDEYPMSLKIFDGQGLSTNQIDLNKESIPVLIEFLTSLQESLDTNNKESNSVVKSAFNSVFGKE